MNDTTQTFPAVRRHEFKRYYRVVMNSRAWGNALRAVLQGSMAFGFFHWHNVSDAHELLCGGLKIQDAKPDIQKLHPAQQWILVLPQLFTHFPQDCLPIGTQGRLVIGLSPNEPKRWCGFMAYREDLLPIAELRVVGSRMPFLSR